MPFDNPAQKAEALNNFTLLDVHRWSDFPEVNNAVNAIYCELKKDPAFGGNKRLRKKHIKVVILDLYATWLADDTKYIAYYCTPNAYIGTSRYNSLHISYLTVPVVDALHRRGFIEHYSGFYNRELDVGRLSRMRSTDRLIGLIKEEHAVPAEAIQHWRDKECIILRNRNKDDIEYKDTVTTRRMRRNLNAYNDLLAQTDISIHNVPAEGIPNTSGTRHVRPVPTGKFVRRIFNNGSWNEGGRFYGGWWQSIPSNWRVRTSIDGAIGSNEIDYSGHHIVLMYANEGIDYWKDDGRDTYLIDDYEQSERMRNLLKLVLLTTINAKDKKGAISPIQKEINFDSETYGWIKEEGLSLKDLIEAFANRHEPIKHHFFSNAGLRLQRLDSEIADEVINHFTIANIPILCVHDSFVINPVYADELKTVMIDAVRRATRRIADGIEITPKLKTLTCDGIII
jgi:hypothetical protein